MKKTILLSLMLLVMLNQGCSSKKSDDNNNVGAANNGTASSFSMSLLPTKSSATLKNDISSFNWAATDKATDFYNILKYLISATENPSILGTVGVSSYSSASQSSAVVSSGVVLRGNVSVDNGVISSDSEVKIEIYDSLVGSLNSEGNYIEPIEIKVAFKEGTMDSKNFRLVFSDQYGSISLNGVFDAGYATVSGALSFANTTNVDTTQPARSGTLGRFFINTCQLFRCL